jgi:hypothetical protein
LVFKKYVLDCLKASGSGRFFKDQILYNNGMDTKSKMGWELGVGIMGALVAPFVLWPVEQVIRYPVVVEELYKAVLVWLVLRGTAHNRFFWVFLVGAGFAISETMVYLMNSLLVMEWGSWGWRWVTTVPMHIVTFFVQYAGWMVGVGPLGIIPAIVWHGWFNQLVK